MSTPDQEHCRHSGSADRSLLSTAHWLAIQPVGCPNTHSISSSATTFALQSKLDQSVSNIFSHAGDSRTTQRIINQKSKHNRLVERHTCTVKVYAGPCQVLPPSTITNVTRHKYYSIRYNSYIQVRLYKGYLETSLSSTSPRGKGIQSWGGGYVCDPSRICRRCGRNGRAVQVRGLPLSEGVERDVGLGEAVVLV